MKKVKHINHQADNIVELHWWFGKSSEQYRFQCKAKLVDDDTKETDLLRMRKEQWGNLSDKAREQFYWRDPGPYEPQVEVPEGGRDSEGKILKPPSTFLLVLLYPQSVDYLRLTDNYRQIDRLEPETSSWEVKRVNP